MEVRWKHVALPLAMGVLFGVVVAAQRAGTPQPSSGNARDISGFWELSLDGKNVPPASLTPGVTKAMLDAHARHDAHAILWCNWLGVPAAMDSPRPIDIRQGAREIIMSFEFNATPRHIYLNRSTHASKDEYDPTTSGDSIAHWDGDTLVVDTIYMDGEKGVTGIPGGGFRTSDSHWVERYRLLNNGAVLSVVSTWDDAKVFRRPHTYEFRYLRAPKFYEAQQPLACDPFDEGRAKFLSQPPAASAR